MYINKWWSNSWNTFKRAILKEGDVLKIDTVLLKNGFNGDAARTFIVGKPKSKEDERLVEITKQAFLKE